MSILEAIFLGILQGLTEFLPVSSSGHLLLFQNILGLEETPLFFSIMLHIGTLVAVFLVFRKDILSLIRHPFSKVTKMLVLATVPTVIFAVIFKLLLGDAFEGAYLGFGFMVTGILLYCMDFFPEGERELAQITPRDALIMGCAQGLGTLPGVSRSGSTIAGGSVTGLTRNALARFSFLMSIPAILGALVLDIKDLNFSAIASGELGVSWLTIIVGMVFSAAVGYVAVKWLLKLITTKSLRPFAYYTFALGFLCVVDKYITHIVL